MFTCFSLSDVFCRKTFYQISYKGRKRDLGLNNIFNLIFAKTFDICVCMRGRLILSFNYMRRHGQRGVHKMLFKLKYHRGLVATSESTIETLMSLTRVTAARRVREWWYRSSRSYCRAFITHRNQWLYSSVLNNKSK